MKSITIVLKFLMFFIFFAFVCSCSDDEYAFSDDNFQTEIEVLPDTLIISTRTRVDDKDGD